MSKQRISSQAGFTLIEVGMASLILVVGFIGMIRAMTFTAGLMDHARRQTVAAQILIHEIEQLRLQSWTTIDALTSGSTATAWNVATAYGISDLVRNNGTWYRCVTANTGQTPPPVASPNPTYWVIHTWPLETTMVSDGATYSVARTVSTLVTGTLREVTFTVTWTVTASRRNADNTPLTFAYSRVNSAFFGKNGLNLSYQRS